MTRHSVMLTHWLGGGAPSDSRTMTYSSEDAAELLADAMAWIADRLQGEEAAALPIEDLSPALWEELTDAA